MMMPLVARNNNTIRSTLLLVVLLLGSALLTTVAAKTKKSRRKRTNSKQEMYAERLRCEMDCLAQWVPEESMNCIHTCRSPTCFDQMYGEEDPLEPGQVDPHRADAFDKCNLSEILEARRKEQEDRKKEMNQPDEEEGKIIGEEIDMETQ
jgi:hypothetical protein